MRILEQGDDLMAVIRDTQEQRTQQRERGLHLSDILYDLAATLYPTQFARETDPTDQTRMYYEWGHVIEDVLAATWRTRFAEWTKPAPKQVEGIWCSPDGWIAESRTIDEIKATWKSARDFLSTPKWWMYQVQTLAYMYGWGASRGRIHVLYVNGDYRPPRPMPPRTYVLIPTQRELKENWRMLMRHAQDKQLL